MRARYSYFAFFCIVQLTSFSQGGSFSSKAQKLIGTFSVYHYKPIAINETTSAVTVDLFIKDLESGKETQVTTDGKNNEIKNGWADWVYEEEFSFSSSSMDSPALEVD